MFFYCRATGKPATATRPAPDRRPRKACAGRERSCRWGCRRDRTLRLARQLLRGGRAHRESVPTGRACPPGGRAHREDACGRSRDPVSPVGPNQSERRSGDERMIICVGGSWNLLRFSLLLKCVSRSCGHVSRLYKNSVQNPAIPLVHVRCMIIASTLQPPFSGGQQFCSDPFCRNACSNVVTTNLRGAVGIPERAFDDCGTRSGTHGRPRPDPCHRNA